METLLANGKVKPFGRPWLVTPAKLSSEAAHLPEVAGELRHVVLV